MSTIPDRALKPLTKNVPPPVSARVDRRSWHDAGPDDTVHERAAQLRIIAGADMSLIESLERR